MPGSISFLKKIFTFALLSKIVPVFGSLAFAVYIGYMVWISIGPEKPEPDKDRKAVATAAVEKAVREIRESRGDVRSAVMIHFANDPSDFVSDAMRNKLNSSGILFLEDISLSERVDKLLNLRTHGASSVDEAVKFAGDHKAESILWGKIDTFESADDGAILIGKWELVDKKGQVICSGKFAENTTREARARAKASAGETETTREHGGGTAVDLDPVKQDIEEMTAPVRETASQIPWYIRFLGFILMVLLLPVVTISFLRWMVAKKSNGINAFVLAVYTIIGAICAFFMIGGEFTSIWNTLLFLGATAFSLMYNGALMSFALKLES